MTISLSAASKRFFQIREGFHTEPDMCAPERRLAYAVLERALRDAMGIKGCCDPELEHHHRRNALKWFELFSFYNPDPDPPPYSWQWVCSVLNINPCQLHKKLLTLFAPRNRHFLETRRRMVKRTFRRTNYEYKMVNRKRA